MEIRSAEQTIALPEVLVELLDQSTADRYSLDGILARAYTDPVWDVEYTDQFEDWWDGLSADQQKPVAACVRLLAERGPGLGRPAVDTVTASRHPNMKELRIGTVRVLFIFDPRRTGILLIAGDKRGQWRAFYDQMVPLADDLYDDHLEELRKEGLTPDD